MKTIMDVVKANPDASVVMIQRHYSYLSGPVDVRYDDPMVAYAKNLSEGEPPVLFLCDKAGIEMGWKQGEVLATSEVEPDEIFTSHQGRGPDSGLRISEGYQIATGKWLPVSCHKAIDYPLYSFDPILKCLNEEIIEFVPRWLNGQRDGVILSDTPNSFKGRVMGFIEDQLQKSGFKILATHYELIVLTHALLVEGKDLGEVSETWEPEKGGGVIVVRHPDGTQEAWDYNSNFELVL